MQIGDIITCYWSEERDEDDNSSNMEIVGFNKEGDPIVKDDEGTYSTEIEDGEVWVMPNFSL